MTRQVYTLVCHTGEILGLSMRILMVHYDQSRIPSTWQTASGHVDHRHSPVCHVSIPQPSSVSGLFEPWMCSSAIFLNDSDVQDKPRSYVGTCFQSQRWVKDARNGPKESKSSRQRNNMSFVVSAHLQHRSLEIRTYKGMYVHSLTHTHHSQTNHCRSPHSCPQRNGSHCPNLCCAGQLKP